jgi:DNA repair exonuclease SbcCD ATPase subunit
MMEQLDTISKDLGASFPDLGILNTERTKLGEEKNNVYFTLENIYSEQEERQAAIKEMDRLQVVQATKTLEFDGLQRDYKILEQEPILVDTATAEDLKTKLSEILANREVLEAEAAESAARLIRLETLKEGFKEIKSYVFNGMLNEVNSRVQQYLMQLFEVPISVKFRNDNMKIETDVTFDGAERGLGLLSGGQFRRVSLAVDLALADAITARKGAQLGVTIWDEYMKDLSEQSMEKVLSLFEARNGATILVEHNSLFKNIVTSASFVRLSNGTSEMVE